MTGEVVFGWTETTEDGFCSYVLALVDLYQYPVEDWRSRLVKERKAQPMSQREFVLANTNCGADSGEYFDVDKKRCAGKSEFLGVIGDWGQQPHPVYTATEIVGKLFRDCRPACLTLFLPIHHTFCQMMVFRSKRASRCR